MVDNIRKLSSYYDDDDDNDEEDDDVDAKNGVLHRNVRVALPCREIREVRSDKRKPG